MAQTEKISLIRINSLIQQRKKKVIRYSNKIRNGYFYCSTNPFVEKHSDIINIKKLNKYYVHKAKIITALENINLSVKNGEFVFIKGTSGSGKTTLMNILCGLVKPSTGDVFIDNYNVSFITDDLAAILRSTFFGFVFQTSHAIHFLTLRENICLASDLLTKRRQKLTNRVPFNLDDLCKAVDLEKGLLDKYPYEVSGGQLQRASLVRAMINNPKILLCDEPTSSLDKTLTLSLLGLLKKINEHYQTTIIFITHDDTICQLGTQVISIENGRIKNITYNDNPEMPTLEDW